MRFSEPPAPELTSTAYARELADTAILYPGMSLADLAHVVMLIEAGVIPPEPGGELLHALLSAHPRPPLDFIRDAASGDLYTNRELYLSMLTPHVGYLSTGRPRREATTIAFRVAVRSRLLKLAEALIEFAQVAIDLADTHRATLFPDYTYLQPAQPTTFGHYLLTFVYPILRDLDRLQAAFGRINVSPAGAGSVNGSRLPLDRPRLAELLGFDDLISHARDAMWQADGPIEIAALISAALINQDRLAEDLQVYSTQEFGLVELADRHSRLSVIMPQKKNPYSLAYVRGLAGASLGTLAAMAAVGKTPSGQPDNRIFAHGDLPRALDQAIGSARLMAGVLGGLTVNADRAAQRAAASFTTATDLAELIMLEAELDYRTAYRIVARVVREAAPTGNEGSAIGPKMLATAAEAVIGRRIEISAESIAGALDPSAIVATRTGIGGASESSITDMLAQIRTSMADFRSWQAECLSRLDEAEANLQTTAVSLAVSPEAASPPESDEGEKTIGDLLRELPEDNWRWRR